MTNYTAGTYYYRDGQMRQYVLILNGEFLRAVKTRKEAEAWYRAQKLAQEAA